MAHLCQKCTPGANVSETTLKVLLVIAITLVLTACGAASTDLATPVPAAAAEGSPSDAPLRASLQRLATAWNSGDGDTWAAEYWPDGSLVNILGVVFPNAVAVGAVTNKILAGPFKGSTFAAAVRRIRFIGTGVAIVEADVSVTNFRALPPGAVPTSPGLLLTRFIYVYELRNGVWKIEASQNTAVLPSAVNS